MSLVELMIALVLGLVVVAAVFNVYLGTAKSQRFTRGLMALQENGRFGLTTLQRGLRLAGFSEALDFAPLDLDASGDDRIVVRAERPFDCNGGDTSTAGGVAENAFAYDPGTEAVTCTGNVDDSVNPLVENVDAFRVLYGLDTDADGVPNRFASHADAKLAGVDEVVALRFALLVNSGDVPVRSRATLESHAVLDEHVERGPDRRLREVFSTTVKLRNR